MNRPALVVERDTVDTTRLSPRGLAVLAAYAHFVRRHPAPLPAPPSRDLRAGYAPTLSRAQWARGLRELTRAGILEATDTATRITLPGPPRKGATQ